MGAKSQKLARARAKVELGRVSNVFRKRACEAYMAERDAEADVWRTAWRLCRGRMHVLGLRDLPDTPPEGNAGE